MVWHTFINNDGIRNFPRRKALMTRISFLAVSGQSSMDIKFHIASTSTLGFVATEALRIEHGKKARLEALLPH